MCNWKYWCFICSLLKLLLFLCVLLRAMPFTWWTRYKPLIRYVTWFCCRDDTKAVSSKESLDRNRKSRKEVKEEKDSKRRMRSVSSEDDKPRRKQRDDSERLVALLSQPFYPRAYFCWECLSCILDLWGSCPSCSKRLYGHPEIWNYSSSRQIDISWVSAANEWGHEKRNSMSVLPANMFCFVCYTNV